MKKLTLTIVAAIISTCLFANNDLEASICNLPSTNSITKSGKTFRTVTISKTAFSNCQQLTLNDKNWKVKSFSVGMTSNKNYHVIHQFDGTLSEKIHKKIKEFSPEKIYIEEIVLINENKEVKEISNFTVIISD